MRESLIIERPALQTKGQRSTSVFLRVMGWLFWLYVGRPVIGFAAWSLGVVFFVDYMLLPETWGYLASLGWYGLFVVNVTLLVVAWSFYNLKRFGGRVRRSHPVPVSVSAMASYYGVAPEMVGCSQTARISVLHLSEEGRIQKLDVTRVEVDVPGIYLSATCCRLDRTGAGLLRAIGELGYRSIPSEHPEFPFSPDKQTSERSHWVIERRADIFLLLVGDRHGSELERGKPVRNMELAWARAKGIPIFAMVDKQVLAAVPRWRRDPEEHLDSTEDSSEILRFVSDLLEAEDVLVDGFGSETELLEAFRRRMAEQVAEALRNQRAGVGGGRPDWSREIGPAALHLAVAKPLAWEVQLFGQVVVEEMGSARHLRRDLEHGLVLGPGRWSPDPGEMSAWVDMSLATLHRLVETFRRLLGSALPEAMGTQGEPGDPDYLIHLGKRFGQGYRELIEWALELQRMSLGSGWQGWVEQSVKKVQGFLDDLDGLRDSLEGGPRFTITAEARLELPIQGELQQAVQGWDIEPLQAELQRLRGEMEGGTG